MCDKASIQGVLQALLLAQQGITLFLMSRIQPIQWVAPMRDATVKPFVDLAQAPAERWEL